MPQEKILRTDDKGRFQRKESEFRRWIAADGSSGFPAEAGRYHLYVAWACPWAHRTLLARKLMGLDDAVSVSVVHWKMDDEGAWHFAPGYEDDLHGHESLQDVYKQAAPDFPGVGTVPVLWDKEEGTIVNNESREIVRMFSTAMRDLQPDGAVTLLPDGMKETVDEAADAIYEPINNGVYKSGFAKTQEAYEEAVTTLFDHLEKWDGILADRRYVCGDTLTEADIFLFTTLLRFDPVYHYHFKCNIRRLRDFENLWGHTREIYQLPGVKDTIDLGDTKRHYFGSHTSINPYRIVPVGPEIDYDSPHGRDRLEGHIVRV